jgi:Tn3 transposase DDE domain
VRKKFKYFGKGQGVSVYTFIDERDLLFHSLVFSAGERESLDLPSALRDSMHSRPEASFMPAVGILAPVGEQLDTLSESRIAFMRAAKASLPERRPSFFKSKVTEWWNAILAACSDVEPVSDMVDLESSTKKACYADRCKTGEEG